MSGTSTPQGGNRSPPPEGGVGGAYTGAMRIGIAFVKQYYKIVMEHPDQLKNFYLSASSLSDGSGNSKTQPVSYATAYEGDEAKSLGDRFRIPDHQLTFDMTQGGIDAQDSINGAIVLVVTGHVVYTPMANEDEDAAVDEPLRKGFVQTFVLHLDPNKTKKFYYVHNDVLRFLKDATEVANSTMPAEAPPLVVTETLAPVAVPEPAVAVAAEPALAAAIMEPAVEEKLQQPPPAVEEKVEEIPKVEEEAPGGGVEETKEEPPAPVVVKPAKGDKPNNKKDGSKGKANEPPKGGNQKGKKGNAAAAEPVPPPSPAPKQPPGSWASLVAGAGGGAATAAAVVATPKATPAAKPKPPAASEKAATPANEKKEGSGAANNAASGTGGNHANNNNNSSNNNNKMGNNTRPPKRDPDCTLVIKNLPESIKESDVLGVFEPFAAQTKARVVGITVAAHRGIAFVDYDSIHPVMKAVNQHKEEAIKLMGRILEVDQKTAEQRARRAQANRNNGGRYGGGGGGSGGSGGRGGGRRGRGGGDGRGDGGYGGRGRGGGDRGRGG